MGIDLKVAQEKAAAAAVETETEVGSESEDEAEGAVGEIREEDSQGASGSSGAGWRMTEPRLLSGKDQWQVQTRSKL